MDWTHMAHKILISKGRFMVHISFFINQDHNPTTSITSIYGLGSRNKLKLTSHITSLTLMESGFSNKSPNLHKRTTKPKVCHLIFRWLEIKIANQILLTLPQIMTNYIKDNLVTLYVLGHYNTRDLSRGDFDIPNRLYDYVMHEHVPSTTSNVYFVIQII